MQIPTISLSQVDQKAAANIIKASKKKTTIGQQMIMANYYAFLHSKKNAVSNAENYAKLLLGK